MQAYDGHLWREESRTDILRNTWLVVHIVMQRFQGAHALLTGVFLAGSLIALQYLC